MAVVTKVIKAVTKRGRQSKRGRGTGTKAEKVEATDRGFVLRDSKGNVKTDKNGNPKPDVKALRKAKSNAKKAERGRRAAVKEQKALAPGVIETQGAGYQEGFPTARSRQAMISSLGTMPKGAQRGEVGKLLRSQRAEDRPPDILPSQGRVARTEGAPSVGEGVNTRLRSLHRPDYKQVHDQAVAHLKREFPGKTEVWYDRKARELIERDFPQFERGQEYIAGTPKQVMGMMRGKEQAYLPEEIAQVTGEGGMEAQLRDMVSQFQAGRRRKRGGIVRRRKGGAIGVGAALRGYGKGYKKRG